MNQDLLECPPMSQNPPVETVTPRFDARRIYTVLVLVPLLYAIIRYLPPLAFTCLVLATGAIALLEFYRFALTPPHDRPLLAVGLFGFITLIGAPHLPELVA